MGFVGCVDSIDLPHLDRNGAVEMTTGALLLSPIQFVFTISHPIVVPSFTIGLNAWLAVLEGLRLIIRRSVSHRLFGFWPHIFAVAFGPGVVSGIVMAMEFGTDRSRLSAASGPIQGPLLAHENFTAFSLKASFFGVLLFGRSRLEPVPYFFSVVMVALGTAPRTGSSSPAAGHRR